MNVEMRLYIQRNGIMCVIRYYCTVERTVQKNDATIVVLTSMYLMYSENNAGHLLFGQKHQSSNTMCLPLTTHIGRASRVVGHSNEVWGIICLKEKKEGKREREEKKEKERNRKRKKEEEGNKGKRRKSEEGGKVRKNRDKEGRRGEGVMMIKSRNRQERRIESKKDRR